MGRIVYNGVEYPTVPFDKAEDEHESRSANGESVIIIDAAVHGGIEGEYFVKSTLRRPGSSDEPED